MSGNYRLWHHTCEVRVVLICYVTCCQVLKRTVQTAVVWTLYEELVPRITALAEAFAHPSQGSS